MLKRKTENLENLEAYHGDKKQKTLEGIFLEDWRGRRENEFAYSKDSYSGKYLEKYFLTDQSFFWTVCETGSDHQSFKNYGLSNKFYIELAVAGGNTYRLLSGESHPEYYTLLSKDSKYYRSSKAVLFLIEDENDPDNFFEGAASPDTLNKLLTTHFKFNTDETIFVGAITQLIFSYFLGDGDVKNILKIYDKNKNIVRVIRIDPEFTFHGDFFDNNFDKILWELNFISDPNLTNKLRKDYINGILFKGLFFESEKGFFESFLEDHTFFPGSKEKELNIFPYRIFFTAWRRFEVFAALSKIIHTPIEAFDKIIDEDISSEFNENKTKVKGLLKERIDLFKKAAFMLDGFEDFYKEYTTKGSYINEFWHNFWGVNPPNKTSIKDAYECYGLNYGKDETPDSVNARLVQEETELKTSRRFDLELFNKYYKRVDLDEEIIEKQVIKDLPTLTKNPSE